MNYLVIETFSVIAFFIFITIGINFLDDKYVFENHPKLFKTISTICFILAAACAIYFILDIFFLNCEIVGWSITKLVCFIFAIIIYAACVSTGADYGKIHGIGSFLLITTLVCLGAFGVGCMETIDIEYRQHDIYNKKVIVQEPKIASTKYTILSLNDTTNIEGSFTGNFSGSTSGNFLIIGGTMQGSQNGEIKNVNAYKFYYVADENNNKILPKTINADETPIYPIKEGETPYLLEIVTTPYSLDYNVDPAQECNFGEPVVTYELYVPANTIIEGFSLDAQ